MGGLTLVVGVKRSQGRARAEIPPSRVHTKVVKLPVYVSEEELGHHQARGQPKAPAEPPQNLKPNQAVPPPPLHPPPATPPIEPPGMDAGGLLNKNNLLTLMENAEAIREYGLAHLYATKLMDYAEENDNQVDLAAYRQKQQKYLALDLTTKRDTAEREAIAAEKDRNYAKAAKLYEICKNLSNQLYKNGDSNEAERTKYFTAKSISIWKLVADTTTFAKEEPP